MLEDDLADLIEPLKARYAEPQRHYHTWAHIEAMLAHFRGIESKLYDPRAVKLAIYWHDAIYDPTSSTNEEESAQLLLSDCSEHVDELSLQVAATIIHATQKHMVPDGLGADQEADLKYFLDIDLSILATPKPVFDHYELDIRAEYSFAPSEAYRQGRRAVLQSFLGRERIYFSDHFYALWEETARQNLSDSIGRVSREEIL